MKYLILCLTVLISGCATATIKKSDTVKYEYYCVVLDKEKGLNLFHSFVSIYPNGSRQLTVVLPAFEINKIKSNDVFLCDRDTAKKIEKAEGL